MFLQHFILDLSTIWIPYKSPLISFGFYRNNARFNCYLSASNWMMLLSSRKMRRNWIERLKNDDMTCKTNMFVYSHHHQRQKLTSLNPWSIFLLIETSWIYCTSCSNPTNLLEDLVGNVYNYSFSSFYGAINSIKVSMAFFEQATMLSIKIWFQEFKEIKRFKAF